MITIPIKKFHGYKKRILLILNIWSNPSSAKDPASYWLLKEKLKEEDVEYIEEARLKAELESDEGLNYASLKRIFIKRARHKNNGQLICEICGKTNLLAKGKSGRQPPNLATMDHKIPISKGGLKYHPNNLICICYKCNFYKNDRDVIKRNGRYMVL